jgi:hypothetical protein
VKGARRQFAQRQQSTDIFFQKDDFPSSRSSLAAPSQEWVPSVKITTPSASFSNIFGHQAEQNDHVKTLPKKTSGPGQTFGVSSEKINRQRQARGGVRSTSKSQIWF